MQSYILTFTRRNAGNLWFLGSGTFIFTSTVTAFVYETGGQDRQDRKEMRRKKKQRGKEVFKRERPDRQTGRKSTCFVVSFFFFTIALSHRDLSQIQVYFPGESQLRQSRATHPTVHAGCFSVSLIHRTLTWTTGSFTCTQMLMHAIAHVGVYGHT